MAKDVKVKVVTTRAGQDLDLNDACHECGVKHAVRLRKKYQTTPTMNGGRCSPYEELEEGSKPACTCTPKHKSLVTLWSSIFASHGKDKKIYRSCVLLAGCDVDWLAFIGAYEYTWRVCLVELYNDFLSWDKSSIRRLGLNRKIKGRVNVFVLCAERNNQSLGT